MQVRDLVLRVAEVCERLRLPYYITGSVASSYYGEGRATLDLDVVVELPSWKVREFCAGFPEDEWYADAEAALASVQSGHMFNIVHGASGLKIDVMGVKDTPFDESRLDRARPVNIYGDRPVMFGSPEDIILKKLEFFREGGSDKHMRDIAGMFKVSGASIDRGYIDMWAERIGVVAEWRLLQERLTQPPTPGI